MLAEAAVIRRGDWGWRILSQDDSRMWLLAGELSSSPHGPPAGLLVCPRSVVA